MLYVSCLPVDDENVLFELLGSVGPCADSTLIYLQSTTCADCWTSSTTCTSLMIWYQGLQLMNRHCVQRELAAFMAGVNPGVRLTPIQMREIVEQVFPPHHALMGHICPLVGPAVVKPAFLSPCAMACNDFQPALGIDTLLTSQSCVPNGPLLKPSRPANSFPDFNMSSQCRSAMSTPAT